MKKLFAATIVAGAAIWPQAATAQVTETPNLCNAIATDIAARYVVQLVSGVPTRTEGRADPLVGRFATAVTLYDTLGCPTPILAIMLECLHVASIDTGGEMRAMMSRRQTCEDSFRRAVFGN